MSGNVSRVYLILKIATVLFVFFAFFKNFRIPFAYRNPEFLKDFEIFMVDWCRVREARTNLEAVLSCCKDQTRWSYQRSGISTDASKSFISSWDLKPAGQFSRFFIQAVTGDRELKTTGGDWWRVFIRGPVSMKPTVSDLGNGTYEVTFLIVEPGIYDVEIVLDYTLCDGFRDPPDDWFVIGDSQGKKHPSGVLRGRAKEDYRLEAFQGGKRVTMDIPLPTARGVYLFNVLPTNLLLSLAENNDFRCGIKCDMVWDGYGRWLGEEWRPFLKARHIGPSAPNVPPSTTNGSIYDTLWIYGDSQARRMYHEVIDKELCRSIFKSCKLSTNWVYTYTSEVPPEDDLDFDYRKITNDIKQVIERPEMTENSVMILNLGLHYVQSTNFSNYVKLLHSIVDVLKQSRADGRRPVRTIWKTSTPLSKEKDIQDYLHSDTKRFLNNPRVAMFNAYATSLMCNEGFEILDVHPLTGSYPQGTGGPNIEYYKEHDIVHYKSHVMTPFEEALEEYFKGDLPKDLTLKNYQFS